MQRITDTLSIIVSKRFRICTLLVLLSGAGCNHAYSGYVAQLRSGDAKERVDAAAFLGEQRVSDAIPALSRALRDPEQEVRIKAVWALGMIRSKRSMRDLIPLLRDGNRRVRQTAAWSLMQMEEPDAIPALEMAMRMENDGWVKGDMRRAIGFLKQFEGETDLNEATFRW